MTLALSVVCLAASAFYALLDPAQQHVIIATVGANPARIAALLSGDATSGGSVVLLSLFFHSSVLHLVGNIVYLWVFGLPVERRMGPWALALVFLLGGALAHLILAVRLPSLDQHVIGASGAVSAVVGACAAFYPTRRIGLYLPLGLVVESVRVPAMLVVVSWFLLQLLYTWFGPTSGAMAWWTHLTGFVLGLLFALLVRAVGMFGSTRRSRPPNLSI
jgi:membrane associated rhomboid family serine protease